DEPTTGLDPQGTREIRSLVRELAGEGVTVVLSSHLLAEVEQVCTDVAVLNRGRLVLQGTVDDLRARSGVRVAVTTPDPDTAAQAMRDLGLADVRVERDVVSADPGEVPVEEVCALLVRAGVRVRELTR